MDREHIQELLDTADLIIGKELWEKDNHAGELYCGVIKGVEYQEDTNWFRIITATSGAKKYGGDANYHYASWDEHGGEMHSNFGTSWTIS